MCVTGSISATMLIYIYVANNRPAENDGHILQSIQCDQSIHKRVLSVTVRLSSPRNYHFMKK